MTWLEAAMRAAMLCILALLLAGCASDVEDGPDVSALSGCDLLAPDGEQRACGIDSVQDLRARGDGWVCTAQHETDEVGGYERTWINPTTGGVGFSWHWPDDAVQGIGRVSVTYEGPSKTLVQDFPFGGTGFVVLDGAEQDPDAEILTWMRFFTIDSPAVDVAGAKLLSQQIAGMSFYHWEVPFGDQTLVFDVMKENDDPDMTLPYYPGARTWEDPFEVTVDQWAKGVRYKPGSAHVAGLRQRWCPEPLGI